MSSNQFEEMELGDFIEDVLQDYEERETLKRLFVVQGFTFRVPPPDNVTLPRMVTSMQLAMYELVFLTVLKDARDKYEWYSAVKAAGYKTLNLTEEEISHVLNLPTE